MIMLSELVEDSSESKEICAKEDELLVTTIFRIYSREILLVSVRQPAAEKELC